MSHSPHSVPDPNAASPGMRRQFRNLTNSGLAGKKLSVPYPAFAALNKKAADVLTPQAYDYVAGSASGERTARANLAAFDRWRIVPRMLRDVSQRDLSVETLLGHTLPAPVFLLGPIGVQNIIHPEAEVAVARAAASLGLPFVLSTVSSRPIEEVAQASGEAPRWFQLYWGKDHELTSSLLQRAEMSGYTALVVTLDTVSDAAGMVRRASDLRHPYLPFLAGHGLSNYFTDPVFGSRLPHSPLSDPAAAIRLWASLFLLNTAGRLDRFLAWLRRQTRLPIVLKREFFIPTTLAWPLITAPTPSLFQIMADARSMAPSPHSMRFQPSWPRSIRRSLFCSTAASATAPTPSRRWRSVLALFY